MHRRVVRALTGFGLACLWAGYAMAVSDDSARWQALSQPHFQIIESEDQHLDGPIRAFAQDQSGFIWTVSDYTLWRWDGYNLRQAHFSGPESAQTPDILTVQNDRAGRIWVGTSNGLYTVPAGTLVLNKDDRKPINDARIDFLAFTHHSNTAYAGNWQTLYVWHTDTNTDKIEVLSLGDKSNWISAVQMSADDTLWVATGKGLFASRADAKGPPQLQPVKAMAGISDLSALGLSKDGTLWVGTDKSGVYAYRPGEPVRAVTLPQFSGQHVWPLAIHEIRPGVIWFGTYGKGIIEYTVENGHSKLIQQQRLQKTNLLDNDIWSFFQDRRGILWIGSRLGANMYNAAQTAIQHLPGGDAKTGIADPLIYSMAVMPNDNVWLGSGNQGIDIVHPIKGLVKHLPNGSQVGSLKIPEDPIESIFLDGNSVLASSVWRTLRFDASAQQAESFSVPERKSNQYPGVFTRFDDRLWLGSLDGLWWTKDGKSANVLKDVKGDTSVNALLIDGSRMWIGTWKGLLRLDRVAPGSYRLTRVSDARLENQYINALHRDNAGTIFVGTYASGMFMNSVDGIQLGRPWRVIDESKGLPSNLASAIQHDAQNRIWVGTNRGLAVFDQKTGVATTILPTEGAAAGPYEASVSNSNGELLFSGGNGVTVINPKRWQAPRFEAPLVITALDGKGTRKADLGLLRLKTEASGAQSITIDPAFKRLSFEFAALDFLAASRLHYRYRLQGYDDDWRNTSAKRRLIEFTGLPPGDYRLQIQYSHDGVLWHTPGLEIEMSVLPAWYQSTPFRIALALFLATLVGLIIHWRTRHYRNRELALARKVQERTAALETANQQLLLQSQAIEQASLTDPLTGLHNRRFLTQHIDNDAALALRRYRSGDGRAIDNADVVFYLIDVDHFKTVNDLWGHAAGDAVLIEMRNRLQQVFRATDYLIRWGGEEFLGVARGTSRSTSADLAERIRDAINGTPFVLENGLEIDIACSTGFAAYPFFADLPDALSWQETLALADTGLYVAKHGGRNAWCGFEAGQHAATDALVRAAKATPSDIDTLLPLRVSRHLSQIKFRTPDDA